MSWLFFFPFLYSSLEQWMIILEILLEAWLYSCSWDLTNCFTQAMETAISHSPNRVKNILDFRPEPSSSSSNLTSAVSIPGYCISSSFPCTVSVTWRRLKHLFLVWRWMTAEWSCIWSRFSVFWVTIWCWCIFLHSKMEWKQCAC